MSAIASRKVRQCTRCIWILHQSVHRDRWEILVRSWNSILYRYALDEHIIVVHMSRKAHGWPNMDQHKDSWFIWPKRWILIYLSIRSPFSPIRVVQVNTTNWGCVICKITHGWKQPLNWGHFYNDDSFSGVRIMEVPFSKAHECH